MQDMSWANLHDYDDLDNSSLDHLNNQIKVSIQPDKGAGYFEDQTDYGFPHNLTIRVLTL